MKKIILLLSLLLLGGCYDYAEIDDLGIIVGLIIDYKDNKYEITSQILEQKNETKIKLYKTTCNQIDECLSDISKQSSKEIFISHLKILLLTENTIKKDINYYDYFLRNPKSKMNFYIYYIDDTSILDKNNSINIKDITDFNNKVSSSSYKLSFLDLIRIKKDKYIEPLYPKLSIKKDKLYLDGLYNNIITLNDKETIMYNLISNNINNSILEIPCDNNTFSLNLNYPKTSFKWNNTFNINIKVPSKISSYNCNYDLNNKDTISKLNNITNNYIKENVERLINKSKKYQIDFIGVGNYIYKHDKKYSFSDNYLNNIKFNINIESNITSSGETRK